MTSGALLAPDLAKLIDIQAAAVAMVLTQADSMVGFIIE